MAELSLNQQKYQQMSVPDQPEYRVTARIEIIRTLRSLIQQRAMVNAFFNMDTSMLLTSIIAVDADNDLVYLDYGPNESQNRQMAQGPEVTFMSSPGSVKVQFSARRLTVTTYQGIPAFRMPVPEKMLLLQRREYHRVDTPIANPIMCEIPSPKGGTIKLPLSDLSVGGISMAIGNSGADQLFPKGTIIPGCRMAIPEMGMLEVTLNVQAFFPITRKDGTKVPHIGCAFVDLRLPMESMVQRYMIKLERARLANA